MKNPDHAERHRKLPELTPELHRFIEGMGLYFESQAIPRIGGRMLGLLMLAHEPLSAEDMAAMLKVSRGSISTNFRLLLASGLMEKITLHGDRTTYYEYSESAMEQRMTVGIRSAESFKKLVQQGLAGLPQKDPARRHLDASLEWSDVLLRSLQQAIVDWRMHHTPVESRRAALKGV